MIAHWFLVYVLTTSSSFGNYENSYLKVKEFDTEEEMVKVFKECCNVEENCAVFHGEQLVPYPKFKAKVFDGDSCIKDCKSNDLH